MKYRSVGSRFLLNTNVNDDECIFFRSQDLCRILQRGELRYVKCTHTTHMHLFLNTIAWSLLLPYSLYIIDISIILVGG